MTFADTLKAVQTKNPGMALPPDTKTRVEDLMEQTGCVDEAELFEAALGLYEAHTKFPDERLVMLPSADGVPYHRYALCHPEYHADMPDEEILALVRHCVKEGQAEGGPDWGWEHIQARLEYDGFTVPLVVIGATWDKEVAKA